MTLPTAESPATLATRLKPVLAILQAAPTPAQLLLVSKQVPAAALVPALQIGLNSFGENYVQEAIEKMEQLAALRRDPKFIASHALPPIAARWFLIGPLQSNKTATVAEHFDGVWSVASEKIATRLSQQRPTSLAPLEICLQIKVDNSPSKHGLALPQATKTLLHLAATVCALPNLRLRGLMCLPDAHPQAAARRENFERAKAAFDATKQSLPAPNAAAFDVLSMGMTDDWEEALAAGSSQIRLGRLIFGARNAETPPAP